MQRPIESLNGCRIMQQPFLLLSWLNSKIDQCYKNGHFGKPKIDWKSSFLCRVAVSPAYHVKSLVAESVHIRVVKTFVVNLAQQNLAPCLAAKSCPANMTVLVSFFARLGLILDAQPEAESQLTARVGLKIYLDQRWSIYIEKSHWPSISRFFLHIVVYMMYIYKVCCEVSWWCLIPIIVDVVWMVVNANLILGTELSWINFLCLESL